MYLLAKIWDNQSIRSSWTPLIHLLNPPSKVCVLGIEKHPRTCGD